MIRGVILPRIIKLSFWKIEPGKSERETQAFLVIRDVKNTQKQPSQLQQNQEQICLSTFSTADNTEWEK